MKQSMDMNTYRHCSHSDDIVSAARGADRGAPREAGVTSLHGRPFPRSAPDTRAPAPTASARDGHALTPSHNIRASCSDPHVPQATIYPCHRTAPSRIPQPSVQSSCKIDAKRSRGDMASPRYFFLLLAVFFLSYCNAGPLPNVTMVDLGLKEGSCALGDVVYMPGDEFPGAGPCERCTCSGGGVRCATQRCEPRPGCKAVHRPDHCCPTYQCECEQEGRVYGNGEKLVDPLDPCRVCYCQGGEVVCRRIACFVRDDCQPRLVPGRCCPEYDNCPVRDGTPVPGGSSSVSSVSSIIDAETSVAPLPPSEPKIPEITIKEITPVSEIPVITDVKIKEILPSPSIEVAEYSSSKSPPITREATSENPSKEEKSQIDSSESKERVSPPSIAPDLSTSSEKSSVIKTDVPPSKISLPTQDSLNNIEPSKIPSIIPLMGPSMTDISHFTTKTAIIEEEDMDHNPAFPPIPDDLFLVLSNHDEEMPEQSLDNEHVPMDNDVKVSNVPISTQEPIFKESPATTVSYVSDVVTVTKGNIPDTSVESSTYRDTTIITQSPLTKENTMLNMRSVIPTDILNSPSLISDDVTGDILDVTESPATTALINEVSSTEMNTVDISTDIVSTDTQVVIEENNSDAAFNDTMADNTLISTEIIQQGNAVDETTNIASKSTEILSETEFSSIPIETSDQNPHEVSEPEKDDNTTESSILNGSFNSESSKSSSNRDEVIIVSKSLPSTNDQSSESVKLSEYMQTFSSQESTTDAVEFIKLTYDSDKNSALIEPPQRNNNVLTDLINLVGDVASISDHTETPEVERHTLSPTTISDSEELIPVNVAAGYKSKNKNWNLNSITEVPLKIKQQNKQKIVEIEDTNNKTQITGRKDIEIITQSYVPTINRRPTKVIMKNEETPTEGDVTSDTSDTSDVAANVSSEGTAAPELSTESPLPQ
ncbi:unnamed protein product, partial [Brenthis ino]